jgi:hypothetical protein
LASPFAAGAAAAAAAAAAVGAAALRCCCSLSRSARGTLAGMMSFRMSYLRAGR